MLPPRDCHFKYRQEKIDAMEREGRIRINERVSYLDPRGERVQGLPEFLQTEDAAVDSSWTDLKGYLPSARYPTENPEELLARVIEASSSPGDLVMDAFAGSGTTLAVAEKLQRRWIGIDCGKRSIHTVQKRLVSLRARPGNSGPLLRPSPFTLYNEGPLRLLASATGAVAGVASPGSQAVPVPGRAPHPSGRQDRRLPRGGRRAGVQPLGGGGALLDYASVDNLHARLVPEAGPRLFLIAPAAAVTFLEDCVQRGGTRYCVLRIPYSLLGEPISPDGDPFDFLRPPTVECDYLLRETAKGKPGDAVVRIRRFESETRRRCPESTACALAQTARRSRWTRPTTPSGSSAPTAFC